MVLAPGFGVDIKVRNLMAIDQNNWQYKCGTSILYSIDSAEDSQGLAIEPAQADSQDSAEGKH